MWKTTFLHGDTTEGSRDVFVEPVSEFRKKLGMGPNQVMRLMGSAYGLRTAPRTWYFRVRKDLEALVWRVHQLDQCTCFLFDGNELIGLCSVYVDDFLIAGSDTNARWKAAKKKASVTLYLGQVGQRRFQAMWCTIPAISRLFHQDEHQSYRETLKMTNLRLS